MELSENNNLKYWRGIEELNQEPEFIDSTKNEFASSPQFSGFKRDEFSLDDQNTYRRDFLKMLGFGVAAASLAACEAPIRKAIPYLNKPEDIDPSIANYYASTYAQDGEYASIVVKSREGRPIKIEGNKLSSVTNGSIGIRAQASVLSLYDSERLRGPKVDGKNVTWQEVDNQITAALLEVSNTGKPIYLVTPTVYSPSFKPIIEQFVAKYVNTKWVQYDPISYYGISKANESTFGTYSIPTYDFSKVTTVVSIGADFLSTWLLSSTYAKQYAKTRRVSAEKTAMSKHYQFETRMSLSGANADYRTSIKPSQYLDFIIRLHDEVASSLGRPSIGGGSSLAYSNLKEAANDLIQSQGKSIVISDSNDPNSQIIVNAINNMLGNYGNTIDLTQPLLISQSNDVLVKESFDNIIAGNAGAVIFLNSNPCHTYPQYEELKKAIKQMKLSISISDRLEETSSLVKYVCPTHHYLESWSDAEPVKGKYSLSQPVISPLYKTRQKEEIIYKWVGGSTDYFSLLQDSWNTNYFSKQSKFLGFTEFWQRSLHDGIFEPTLEASSSQLAFSFDVTSIKNTASNAGMEYIVYQKPSLGAGEQGNSPWLQEIPDPISKACWDNYLAIPLSLAKEKGLEKGDVVAITVGTTKIELPILVQPGQAKGTLSIALGYGREKVGVAGNNVGKNVASLLNFSGSFSNSGIIKDFVITGEKKDIAQTQTHSTIMGRPVVQETILKNYKKDQSAGRYKPVIKTPEGDVNPAKMSIWKNANWERKNHAWGMVIDLNTCFGCGACVVSCQAENNVPVVGKAEVMRSREMHWIRIDRYYTSDALNQDDKSIAGLMDKQREEPSENPRVVFQPMMCQHCNNAPCESVCPVLATTHSTEGLNQMTYNRCIGTRYCANNCPYKVRRFNWFSYYSNKDFKDVNPSQSSLGRMVLNPDVTVRARGVMEKCSMCIQRIQGGKLKAKMEKRRPIDGEIVTACAQACPSESITFGDMNDRESNIAKLIAQESESRLFYVLDEINTRPSVSYLTKVRNVTV